MKKSFSNFGFTTILLSFVMICVVTFSALSLVTAYSDYKLSKKVAENNTDYYEASEAIYNKLAQITSVLRHWDGTTVMSRKEYYDSLEGTEILPGCKLYASDDSYYVDLTEDIKEDHRLEVTIRLLYPESGEDLLYRIISWRSVYDKEPPEDPYLDLIQ